MLCHSRQSRQISARLFTHYKLSYGPPDQPLPPLPHIPLNSFLFCLSCQRFFFFFTRLAYSILKRITLVMKEIGNVLFISCLTGAKTLKVQRQVADNRLSVSYTIRLAIHCFSSQYYGIRYTQSIIIIFSPWTVVITRNNACRLVFEN